MLSTTTGGHKLTEIEDRSPLNSIVFLRDGKQIVGGGDEGALRYWDVKDGQPVEAVACGDGILVVAVSKDGQRVVCGTKSGLVTVWDTQRRKKIVDIKGHTYWVSAVDISPDAKRVGTASYDGVASIWDISTGQLLVGPIRANSGAALVAFKFSASGSRVATSSFDQTVVGIRDAQTGALLVDIPVKLSSSGNEPTVSLAWSSDDKQLFTASYDGTIQCFDTSSGALLFTWPIHSNCQPASIVLSNNGKFIATSADSSISFWDTTTRSQLGPTISHSGLVQSISLSPDDNFLVSAGRTGGKIIVWNLRSVLPESYNPIPVSNSVLALLQLSGQVCELWMQENWQKAEMAITEALTHLTCPDYRFLANRALIRARMQDWVSALDDAQQSLEIERSVIGYLAMAMARVCQGELQAGIRMFDLVFMHCNPEEVAFLLLIRSIILFEAGEQCDAMARIHDLIDTVDHKSIFQVVQAKMFALLGNKAMEEGDYEGAIKLFKRTQIQPLFQTGPQLETISLIFGWKFHGLAFSVRRQLCEALHATGRMRAAAEALLETVTILPESIRAIEEATKWFAEFTTKCVTAFESMGDAATHSQDHNEAIEHYSVALSLKPKSAQGLYLKRSRSRTMMGLWEDAISDADQVIVLDPTCPWGYKRKHAAFHGAQRFDEAVDAFTKMLSAIENSLDADVRQRRKKYVSPSEVVAAIDAAIDETFKTCPLVLIDVKTGLLCDGPERSRVFKADSIFKELVSSMTEELDENYILQVVSGYFRYVMLSHTWQGKEPSFQDVGMVKSVWTLPPSPLNDKLRKFCEIVRDDGYRWAWSDTCCINKSSSELLSRSLVSMYRWYEESAATLALLVGVISPSKSGDLTNSLWMTRAWTLLELLASKVVRFYDSDWKLYLSDTHSNHKESPTIVQELASALRVPPEIITSFCPDVLDVREVFRLASTRVATVDEDAAYSLIGILSSDITPKYGAGEAALGNLIEEILTRSGEISLLAWSGKSSGFNSCFPASLSVYRRSLFNPPPMSEEKLESRVATLRTTFTRQDAMTVYDRITRLPPVIGAHRRLHLPCIVFPVKKLRRSDDGEYRAKTSVLGEIEFQTKDVVPLSGPRKLFFVHPWIRGLLDQVEAFGRVPSEDTSGTDADTDSDVDFNSALDIESNSSGASVTPMIIEAKPTQFRLSSFPSLSSIASRLTRLDDYTSALRFVARLEQPFSALLFQQTSNGKFKRIAAEHEIIVRPRQVSCSKDVQTAVLEVL